MSRIPWQKKEEQFPDNLRMASQIKTISDTDVRCNIILQVRIDNRASGVKVKVTMTLRGFFFQTIIYEQLH